MTSAAVLMCWNIPRMSEDLLYELFCNAGPIEKIFFATNGKSCFIVYQHKDAVVTAKDIFKDVKLDGRPLKMFDHDEIAKIYSHQDERIAQNQNHQYENNPSPNFINRSYEGSHHLWDGRPYSNYIRNAPIYGGTGSEGYPEPNRRNLLYDNVASSHQPENENRYVDGRANSMYNIAMMCFGSDNGAQNLPALLPSTSSQSPTARQFDSNSYIHDLTNESYNPTDDFTNPYAIPVSRNSPYVWNRFSNRSSQPAYPEYNVDFSGAFTQEQHSRNIQEESNRTEVFNSYVHHGDASYSPRNMRASTYSNYYRHHPYHQYQPDRESNAGEPKSTNLSPVGVNFESRNPYAKERGRKRREQRIQRSRRY